MSMSAVCFQTKVIENTCLEHISGEMEGALLMHLDVELFEYRFPYLIVLSYLST